MRRSLLLAGLLAATPAAAQTVDAYGRAITVQGNTYSVPGIAVTAPNLAAALNTLNAMPPPGAITPDPPTTISALDFIRRFTPAEQQALQAANSVWGLQIAAAGTINVTDATLIADMQAAVAAGALTQARMTQVLNLAVASP